MEQNSQGQNENKKQGFFSKIMVEVANQCCIIISALILLAIFDGAFKIFGYYIAKEYLYSFYYI